MVKLSLKTGTDVKYLIQDHLGSTTALTDSTGAVTATQTYDSFGNGTNANFPTRYQYTGREFDAFSKLYYYRARFYDPKLGRFISEDPIGFAGGDLNLYGYVWNNPINWSDPTGLYPFKLPANPSQLPSGWTPDSSHKNPNGSRWTSPSGESKIEFEPGRADENGWRGKDHWHKWVPDPKNPGKWIKDDTHHKPGDEIEVARSYCPVPSPRFVSQPSMEEIRLQIQAAESMERFWGTILVGSAVGGVVVIAPGLIPALIPQIPQIARQAPGYVY